MNGSTFETYAGNLVNITRISIKYQMLISYKHMPGPPDFHEGENELRCSLSFSSTMVKKQTIEFVS